MGPSIGSTATTSQSPDGASLRPRARRLISDLDDEQVATTVQTTPYARFDSATSRRVRPSDGLRHEPFQAASPVRNGSTNKAMSGTWSHLSGIAAGIFGTSSREGSPQGKRDPRHSLPAYSTAAIASSWGPPLQHKDIGSGSADKRAAKLRDEKRKALLTGNDVPFRAAGHKRRTSDDLTRQNLAQEEAEQEMLVYVHHVRPGDTLPGISIKYSCQVNALRKANRIWPNDPIQSRKLIFVPVDASAIKGKPYTGQETSLVEEDLLGDETITLHESPQLSRSPKQGTSAFADSHYIPPTAPLSPASTSNNTEFEYKHDSWVMLPNDISPTEIARLSRQNLGYFPRARRKSVGFSDRSTTSRNTSFDLGRTVQSSPLIRPHDAPDHDILSSLIVAPSSSTTTTNTSSTTSTRRPTSSTRPSYTTRTRSSSNPTVSNFLRGPGGVGTMGRHVRTIGPGNERLTELFGHHIYSVEPPRHQTVFTPWTPSLILEADDGIARTNGVPIASAGPGTGVGLQEVGGAIEGWVRKFAKRAATALDNNGASLGSASASAAAAAASLGVPNSSTGASGAGLAAGSRGASRTRNNRYRDDIGSGVGDLIELVDAFELPSSAHAHVAAQSHAHAHVVSALDNGSDSLDALGDGAGHDGHTPIDGLARKRATNGAASASASASAFASTFPSTATAATGRGQGIRGRRSTRSSTTD